MQPVIETEPITETRGDDWLWPLALLGDDDAPVDLTGATFDGAAAVMEDEVEHAVRPVALENARLATALLIAKTAAHNTQESSVGSGGVAKSGKRNNNSNSATGGTEKPTIDAKDALTQIASSGDYYDAPDDGTLGNIWAAVAADLLQGTSRLVDGS